MLQEKALKYTENLASAKEVELVEGAVTLTRTGSPRNARSYELKSEDPKERDNEITARALDLAADFMDNHVIQLRMPKSLLEEDTSLEEEGKHYDAFKISDEKKNITEHKMREIVK